MGRYLNAIYYWLTADATTESRRKFDKDLLDGYNEAIAKAKAEELKEEAQSQGRELTRAERLALARPANWDQITARNVQSVAELARLKTKAQHDRERNEARRLAGEQSAAQAGE